MAHIQFVYILFTIVLLKFVTNKSLLQQLLMLGLLITVNPRICKRTLKAQLKCCIVIERR